MEIVVLKKNESSFVKYALLFVLWTFIILLLTGCQTGSGASKNEQVSGAGSITDVRAERFSGKNDKVRVYITVSEKIQVRVTLDNGRSETRNCNNQCQQMFNKVGDAGGTITVSAGNDVVEVAYPPNP